MFIDLQKKDFIYRLMFCIELIHKKTVVTMPQSSRRSLWASYLHVLPVRITCMYYLHVLPACNACIHSQVVH